MRLIKRKVVDTFLNHLPIVIKQKDFCDQGNIVLYFNCKPFSSSYTEFSFFGGNHGINAMLIEWQGLIAGSVGIIRQLHTRISGYVNYLNFSWSLYFKNLINLINFHKAISQDFASTVIKTRNSELPFQTHTGNSRVLSFHGES